MNAHDTMWAARRLWQQQNDQLSFEDPAPDSDDGSADAPTSDPPVAGRHPGPDTPSDPGGICLPSGDTGAQAFQGRAAGSDNPLVGGTNDASPVVASRTVTIPDGASPDQHHIPMATAANLHRFGAAVAGGEFT